MIGSKKLIKYFSEKVLESRLRATAFYRKYTPMLPVSMVMNRNSVSHDYKFAYFHVPKAANTTVKMNLYHLCGNKLPVSDNERQVFLSEVIDYFSHVYQFDENELSLFQSEYFKFSFVRDPYSRVQSVYSEKIRQRKSPRKLVERYLGIDSDREISIDEFLCFLESGGLLTNGHWAPQYMMLTMPIQNFDFIGKVENFQDDFEKVQSHVFGCKSQIFSWRFHSSGETGKEVLTACLRKRIYKLYQEDFERFKYTQ